MVLIDVNFIQISGFRSFFMEGSKIKLLI